MKQFSIREHGLKHSDFRVGEAGFALSLASFSPKKDASHLCLATAWLSKGPGFSWPCGRQQ